ncbi:hypothetical protein [Paraflavitalea pollutisoli]|uniref:hypothetical protein n=1 Tax=Paraflavitalea pollutisoli TaxID=3034143 RepID=UPI0023EBBD83|nr:hypothetical protein [Paraflavitalea sp. H1-2-19X]
MAIPYSYRKNLVLTLLWLLSAAGNIVVAQSRVGAHPGQSGVNAVHAIKDTTKPVKTALQKAKDSLLKATDTTVKSLRKTASGQLKQIKQSATSQRDQVTSQLKQLSAVGKDSTRTLSNPLAILKDPRKDSAQFLKNLLPKLPLSRKDSTRLKAAERLKQLRIKDSLRSLLTNPFQQLLTGKPLLKVNGGYVSYQFNYRSAIDTPYVEKDIAQHNVTGNLNLTVAGYLPFKVNFWSRQSNSAIFRDITEVQATFDAPAFRQQLQQSLKNRLLSLAPHLRDSLTEKLLSLKKLSLAAMLPQWQVFTPQALVEAHELIKVPRITWQPHLPDSTNQIREDSLKKIASAFLDLYEQTKAAYDRAVQQVDSLQKVYDKSLAKVQQFKQLVTGRWDDLVSSRHMEEQLQSFGMNESAIPPKYKWLLGLRQFSLGRSVTNYSDLTVKNTSVNGINVEYNSWYYFALSAGLVDYRYRDFVVNGANKKAQYLFLARAGLGRLEKNFFILSVFRGEKQLFPSSGARLSSINVTGISAEAKWQLNPSSYISGEIAKSLAPDFRNNPIQGNTKFDLRDRSNQAYAVKAYTFITQTGTRLEGFYKYTGANYQSFSSFQTNAALESWSVKGEQNFFRRKLRLTASLRKNEFTNPFLPQDYNSNTIFKSLTASFRMRRWPVITVGYQPMSQLTALDSIVVENRFQVLNGSSFHTYKLGDLRTASTLVLNKYFNTSRDTAFLYYNATNVFAGQQFFFTAFTGQLAASYTHNGSYRLVVLDGGIQLNLGSVGTVGGGVKVNNLNDDMMKAGGYINANIRVYKQDFITLSYDRGYLPGFNKSLVRNELATIQFVKSFGVR